MQENKQIHTLREYYNIVNIVHEQQANTKKGNMKGNKQETGRGLTYAYPRVTWYKWYAALLLFRTWSVTYDALKTSAIAKSANRNPIQ